MKCHLRTLVIVALICCLLVAAASITTSGTAQQPEKVHPNWRYQIITHGQTTLILLDTQTGRAWSKTGANDWVDLKTPPSVKD